jgi:NMD protein affecting ribosome stability and mRNA decay
MNVFEGLTWTCHVCGRERPDALISVAHVVCDTGEADGIPVTANVRYCNDRQACYAGVEELSFVKSLKELYGRQAASG